MVSHFQCYRFLQRSIFSQFLRILHTGSFIGSYSTAGFGQDLGKTWASLRQVLGKACSPALHPGEGEMDRITNHFTKIMMWNKAPEMTRLIYFSLVLLYLLMTLWNDPRTDNFQLQWQACFHEAHLYGLCSLDVEI